MAGWRTKEGGPALRASMFIKRITQGGPRLRTRRSKLVDSPVVKLELELIQSQMAHKPMLRGEVGARAWHVLGQARGGVWGERRSAGRLNEQARVVKPIRRVCGEMLSLCGAPRGD